jgi:hypothetical protein
MSRRPKAGLSGRWIVASFAVFIAAELLLGVFVGKLVSAKFVGHVNQIRLEVMMILGSYYVGGFIIGLVSPRVRIAEPAIGAGLAVMATFLIGFFTPVLVLGFRGGKMLIGGAIAFTLAFLGSRTGERIAAMLGNEESQSYFN